MPEQARFQSLILIAKIIAAQTSSNIFIVNLRMHGQLKSSATNDHLCTNNRLFYSGLNFACFTFSFL
jgi:hypothetical protein